MSLSTVSATIQDPSGQIFANGTWQLVFKPTPNTPGLFTDSGVPFTTLFGGALDATGSFSQAGVARNDTIAPAGSKWSLIVSPNANGQAYSVDLNVNNGAFNASAAINAVITNIAVQATSLAHAYKDSEVIPVPGSGGVYFDVVRKTLKVYDPTTSAFLEFAQITGAVLLNPGADQSIISGNLNITNNLNIGTTGTLTVANIKQLANNFFNLVDGNGVSRFFLSNTSPYTNTFLAAISGGALFLGGAAKASVINDTGQIITASNLALQTAAQTLPATVANDTSGGISETSNGGKVLQWTNAGVLVVNPSALGSGAALTVGGTSATTGGMSIFVGASGSQTEVAGLYPADGSSAALRVQALSIRTPSAGFLSGAQVAGISTTGVATGLRVTPRQVAMADATSITPTSDTADINTFVSTQAGGTLTVNAPSGTPTDGQKLVLRLKSTNAQTYSFNATYAFSTSVVAPTTLAAGKTDYIGLMWNATNTKWDVVAVDQGH